MNIHVAYKILLIRLAHCAFSSQVFGLSHTQTVVLRRKEAIAATKEVLKQHNIAAQRSPDL